MQTDGLFLCLPATNGRCELHYLLPRDQWRCCLMQKTGHLLASGVLAGRYDTCYDLGLCLPAEGTPLSPPCRQHLYMPILNADLSPVRDMHDVANEMRTQTAERKRARLSEQAQERRAAVGSKANLQEAEAVVSTPDVPVEAPVPLPDDHFDILRLMFEMPDTVPRDNALGYPGLVEFAEDKSRSLDEKIGLMKDWPDIHAGTQPPGLTRRAAILRYDKLVPRPRQKRV